MLPLLLAAAAPSIMKGITGLFQMNRKVERRNTIPEAFLENEALTRQAANTNRLPGEGLAVNRIAQQTAATNAGAALAGGSSANVLAMLGASDARQQQALADLAVKGEGFRQQQQGQLRQVLGQKATMQQHDTDVYAKERADLHEGGLRNLFGGLDGLSQVAAYGLAKGSDGLGGTSDGVGAVDQVAPRAPRLNLSGLGTVPNGLSPYGNDFRYQGRRRTSIPMELY